MSSKKSYNDIELLRKYYNGQLNETEKNALEQRALEDPFFKEAMDGFDEHPNSFNQFSARHLKSKNVVGKTLITAIIALGLMALAVVLLNQSYPEDKNQKKDPIAEEGKTDSLADFVEVEMLPIALDTLVIAIKSEQITPGEVVESAARFKKEKPSEKTDVDVENTETEEPSKIEVPPEDLSFEDHDFEIENPEKTSNNLNKSTPATFMHDMYVADYRYIPRKGKNISYTRYELSGVSAAYENDSTKSTSGLVERKVEISYTEYLNKSMEYFSRGKYKKALNRYMTILEQYPDDINALFYGGLSYFNLKQYEEALKNFTAVQQHELFAFKEESKWYMAKSLIRLNKVEEAKNLLDEIIAQGGFYTKDAITLKKSF